LELIELLRGPRSIVVYACIADFAELAPRRGRLEHAERTLLRSSDLVLAQGARLTAQCERWSDRVHRIECAVDLDRFPAHPSAAGDSPLESLPRPVIGYVGGLHRQLDLNLAARLARARPEWSWVYVGPVQTPLGDLPALPNVHLPGRVPRDELAATIERFDVGIVPYRIAPSTETVFPIKLLEYLAAGKPAVSTPLPEVERFDAEHGIVTIAPPRPDEFVAAMEGELDYSDDGARAAARRRAAESRDWATQMARIGDLIAGAS
jgi:glycosyltransferase involved in cell wall biosynthesis